MSASVVGIEKPVVIDRKQNLREHRLYWVGRRTQDVVLSALALVVLSPVMPVSYTHLTLPTILLV